MAETTKEKKGFRTGAYALLAGVLVAVVLVIITIYAFTARYTAFSPEKVAQTYVDTIVQTGDGYNAYKNTLVSKNSKYGDFIRNAYMCQYYNEDAPQADFVGTGSEEESAAISEVYGTMYDYYVELLNTYGLDDYDAVFSNYFAKLVEVRKDVYGDEYMDDEFMFGAFESNVSTYGQSLTGTKRTFASDDKTIIQEETVGAYQTMFGTEQEVEVDVLGDNGKKKTVTESQLVYKFTTAVKDCTELSEEETAAYIEGYSQRIKETVAAGEAKAAEFDGEVAENIKAAVDGLDNTDSISAVAKCTVEVTLEDGTVVASQEVYVVQIGNSWYVDNTNVDTSGLYFAK